MQPTFLRPIDLHNDTILQNDRHGAESQTFQRLANPFDGDIITGAAVELGGLFEGS